MTNKSKILTSLIARFSPELATRLAYYIVFRKRINLNDPQTLDEKIQWLKLHDYYNNDLIRDCADKYKVREYVTQCGCPEILNELYGAYNNADEIPWEKLPQKFVVKWNFGCGQNLICHDKSKLDIEEAKAKINKWFKLKDTFYLPFAEMQYRGIEPKLVCERFIESESGSLPVDYKFYCFGGKADCVLVCSGRDESGHGAKFYFFDRDWNLLRYNRAGIEAPEGFTLPKPEGIEKLFDYAEKLSKPFPFVRADFYMEKGQIYFGELTFTPCAGMDKNRLPETQLYFGKMVKINK